MFNNQLFFFGWSPGQKGAGLPMAEGVTQPGEPPPSPEDTQALSISTPKNFLSASKTEPLPNLCYQSKNNQYNPEKICEDQSQLSYLQIAQRCNRSYRDLPSMGLQTDSQSDSFSLKPVSMFQGKPAVIFPLSEKTILVDKLKMVLVGKFSHGMPRLNIIRKFFDAKKLQRSVSISMFDKKHVFIECHNKVDYNFIWLHLSWVIEGCTMRVLKWSADFNPIKECAIVPVWIRLENLPLYMFDEMTLATIANCVGKPIKVDPRNVDHSIVNSARICVELDVSKPLLDSIWVNFEDDATKVIIESFMVKVFYDVVPPYCGFCSHIGHGLRICKRRKEIDVQDVVVVQNPDVQDAFVVPVQAVFSGINNGLFEKDRRNNEGRNSLGVAGTPVLVTNCSILEAQQGQLLGATILVKDNVKANKQIEGLLEQNMVGREIVGLNTQDVKDDSDGSGAATHLEQQESEDTGAVLVEEEEGVGTVIKQTVQGALGDGADFSMEKGIKQVDNMLTNNSSVLFAASVRVDVAVGHDGAAGQELLTGSKEKEDKEEGGSSTPMSNKVVQHYTSPSWADWAEEEEETEVNQIAELLTTRNSFAVLNEEVPIEDLTWEEIEIVVEEEEDNAEQIRIDTTEKEEKEPQFKIVTQLCPLDIQEFAIKEIDNICDTPNKVKPVFEASPIFSNQYILDKDGSPVSCSDVIGKSRRMFKVRNFIDRLKHARGSYRLKNKDSYDQMVSIYTKEMNLAIKEHQQGIYFNHPTKEKATSLVQQTDKLALISGNTRLGKCSDQDAENEDSSQNIIKECNDFQSHTGTSATPSAEKLVNLRPQTRLSRGRPPGTTNSNKKSDYYYY